MSVQTDRLSQTIRRIRDRGAPKGAHAAELAAVLALLDRVSVWAAMVWTSGADRGLLAEAEARLLAAAPGVGDAQLPGLLALEDGLERARPDPGDGR